PLARHLAPVRGGWQLAALRGHRRVCDLRQKSRTNPVGGTTSSVVHRGSPSSPRGGQEKRRAPHIPLRHFRNACERLWHAISRSFPVECSTQAPIWRHLSITRSICS